MHTFCKKIILFTFWIVSIVILTSYLFAKSNLYHFAWGNKYFQLKLAEVKHNPEINTLFLGSSHFYRHIDVAYFDDILDSTNSYNLGVEGLANPENYYLLEELLEDDSINVKSIFLALTSLQSTSPENFFKGRSSYHVSTSNLWYALNTIREESRPFKTKIFRYSSFLLNYGYNYLGLPALRDMFKYKKNLAETHHLSNKGYLSLDDDLRQEVKARHNVFLEQEKALLQNRKLKAKKQFETGADDKYLIQAHYNKIVELINKAKLKKITLFFVITPRLKNYKEILSLKDKLSANQVIDLANPARFPEFYEVENSFDIGHLNKKGAIIFTEKLAEEFLKKKKQ